MSVARIREGAESMPLVVGVDKSTPLKAGHLHTNMYENEMNA